MPPPIEAIPFNPRRFRTAAAHYLAGRPPYAPRLIERVAASSGLRTTDRVLDLGCGPGQLAQAFAPCAGEVLGIDPEPEMLRLASQNAPANVRFLEGSSYDLGPRHGSFHLVTMGRSFHWMDRVDTLNRLHGLITPNGLVALFKDQHPDIPENAWRRGYMALLERHEAEDKTRQWWRQPDFLPHISVLLASPFCELEEISVIERRKIPAQALVDRALSRSTTSRAQIGDARTGALVADLTALLNQLAPDGNLTEVVASKALLARRP
jgi:ubiquinone/menaquinone biosynthesis C-methylase UbiE